MGAIDDARGAFGAVPHAYPNESSSIGSTCTSSEEEDDRGESGIGVGEMGVTIAVGEEAALLGEERGLPPPAIEQNRILKEVPQRGADGGDSGVEARWSSVPAIRPAMSIRQI